MTDETKGDGMTLDKLRDKVAELVGAVACNGSLMQWAVLGINSYIDAHLAAQSAMRVDEDAEFRKWFDGEQGKAYDGMWCFARAAWMHRAAIGKPQP